MRKLVMSIFIGLSIAGNCKVASADHPAVGFSSLAAGPAITIPATTLPKGTAAATLRVEYIKFDTISDARLARLASEGTQTHSVSYLLSPSVSAGYGFTDHFTAGVRLPYVYRGDIRAGHDEEGEAESHHHGGSDGVGDLTLLGQYRLVQKRDDLPEPALLAGVKMPTGATGVRDRGGERFEMEHQPGSGSWDALLGFAVSRRFGGLSLDGNILYTFATGGAQRTNLGDRLYANLAVSFRPGTHEHHHDHEEAEHRHHSGEAAAHDDLGEEAVQHHVAEPAEHHHLEWDLIIELNGEWQEKQKIDGVVDPNSGGTLLYVSPGIRLCAPHGWAGTLSVGLPVHQDPNGVQHETEVRTVLAVSKGF